MAMKNRLAMPYKNAAFPVKNYLLPQKYGSATLTMTKPNNQ
jgi:hypothetical protein